MRTRPLLLAIWIVILTGGSAIQAEPLVVYASHPPLGGTVSLHWTDDGGQTPPLPVNGPPGMGMSVTEFTFVPGDTRVIYRANPANSGSVELFIGGTLGAFSGRRLNPPLTTGGSVTQYTTAEDGVPIAYIADEVTVGIYEVFVTDLNGGRSSQKINPPPVIGGNVVGAGMSPDGRWLAFRADLTRAGKFELFASAIPTTTTWRINLDLADDEDVSSYALSPDSTRLAYLANQSDGGGGFRHHLFTRPIHASGVSTPIADQPSDAGDVVDYRFSPSGDRIALLKDRDTPGQFELYLANADGTGATGKISAPMSSDRDVQRFAFSPDGLWLAYQTNLPGPFASQGELFLTSVATGGTPTKVNQLAQGHAGAFAFSSDSLRLAYQQAASGTSRFDLYERATSLAGAERKVNGAATAGESIIAFEVGASDGPIAYIGNAAGIGNLYLSRLDGAGVERRVNPAGQSVAAFVMTTDIGESAAEGDWRDYR
jgi:Tol biopolymer transport system component